MNESAIVTPSIDRMPLLLGGELRNSSASSVADIEARFAQVARLHLNTVLAPVSWELLEREEGCFDFTLIESMIETARRLELRLVPLWFGTLKNAISCYAPVWVKTDDARFPRAQAIPGRGSWAMSVFHEAIVEADGVAFAALMRRVRELDPEARIVPMVQVENEPGILNTSRDRGPEAERAFAERVPESLMAHLSAHASSLHWKLARAWSETDQRKTGAWADVFGRHADEVFMAWHIARFVDRVAAAGRFEHALPMFANAWLSKGPGYLPGQYPSGGPLAWLMDVWRAAAPHLDLIAPDIYQDDFRGQCADFDRPGNALLIPEARNTPAAAANALYAFGAHRAIGFAPFAIDDCDPDHPLGEVYARLSAMMPILSEVCAAGRTTAFLQQEDEGRYEAKLAGVRFVARAAKRMEQVDIPGVAMLVALEEREFVVLGRNLIVTFEPTAPHATAAELLWLEEGAFEGGKWVAHRRLNGDETAHGTGLLMHDRWCCYRFAVHDYA